MTVARVNALLTPENVMWGAAGLSFVLLLLSGPAARVAASARRDGATRAAKILLFFAVALVVLFPALVLMTGEVVPGVPCGFYLLFFALFCYYLGRAAGRARGRSEVSELIGLDMFGSVEEAQDRLYESRQRHATRGEVEQSIIALSAAAKDGAEAVPDVAVEEFHARQ